MLLFSYFLSHSLHTRRGADRGTEGMFFFFFSLFLATEPKECTNLPLRPFEPPESVRGPHQEKLLYSAFSCLDSILLLRD